ncbi:MAG: heavy-metal-associated domain-containing protein [Bacteroidales bacterium]
MIPFLGFASSAAEKTTFKVYGNCGMCEARIEKAAKIDGVISADWSQETKMLTLEYDAEKVDLQEVHQAIADAGHDTEKVKADDKTYEALPGCCLYERKESAKENEEDHSGHQH